MSTSIEAWLRGPLPGIPPLLQPVAHALVQVRDEVNELLNDFPDELLWERPAGLASPAFHVQHVAGVLDRLLTYAREEALSAAQLEVFEQEGKQQAGITTSSLLYQFNTQIETALKQIGATDETILTAARSVGRRQLPTTLIGLLVHAAEHSMRHTGQLLVTVRVLQANR